MSTLMTMATGKAAVLESYEKGLQVQDVPIPKPTNGEIIIRVLAFHLLAYSKNVLSGSQQGYTLPLPLTPGGSCVGRVHATGPDTTAFQEGQLVLCDPAIRARDDPSAQCLLGLFRRCYRWITEVDERCVSEWVHGAVREDATGECECTGRDGTVARAGISDHGFTAVAVMHD